MSVLRYYDLPFDSALPAKRSGKGPIDRLCARLWAWAAERQQRAAYAALRETSPHLLRDIGVSEVELTDPRTGTQKRNG